MPKNTPLQNQQAQKILDVLTSQKFADWYAENGEFNDYIQGAYPKGHPKEVTKQKVLDDIASFFKL